jgi:2'-5' RNA ligase
MRKIRIFVAIPVPEEMASRIRRALRNDSELPVRFLPDEQWHITLAFLGSQEMEVAAIASRAAEETAMAYDAPIIKCKDITYGPLDRHNAPVADPRMIWLNCVPETSRTLARIKDCLSEHLLAAGVHFKEDRRQFHAHVTLARFPAVFREKLPKFHHDFLEEYEGDRIVVMQSTLLPSGAAYDPLASFAFRGAV